MINEDTEIDTYLRLKYGYPLTKESYTQMPDELVSMIYNSLSPRPKILKVSNMRFWIGVDFDKTFRVDRWATSSYTWNIIREYHEKHG